MLPPILFFVRGGGKMDNTRIFGRIAREHRERRGLTIMKMAELCNMSVKGYELIELGDSDPKLSNVLKIAGALQIDMGMLNSCIPVLIEI